MANGKNTPTTKGTEQRDQHTASSNASGKANMANQPGDRSATDGARTGSAPGTHHKGAETTQPGGTNRNMTGGDERMDRGVAGQRSTGQNPTGERNMNDGELRDENEEDAETMPSSDDAEADRRLEDMDRASADDEDASNVK